MKEGMASGGTRRGNASRVGGGGSGMS
jgi:hypothetical protein